MSNIAAQHPVASLLTLPLLWYKARLLSAPRLNPAGCSMGFEQEKPKRRTHIST